MILGAPVSTGPPLAGTWAPRRLDELQLSEAVHPGLVTNLMIFGTPGAQGSPCLSQWWRQSWDKAKCAETRDRESTWQGLAQRKCFLQVLFSSLGHHHEESTPISPRWVLNSGVWVGWNLAGCYLSTGGPQAAAGSHSCLYPLHLILKPAELLILSGAERKGESELL